VMLSYFLFCTFALALEYNFSRKQKQNKTIFITKHRVTISQQLLLYLNRDVPSSPRNIII
jgi:hypothetical protein